MRTCNNKWIDTYKSTAENKEICELFFFLIWQWLPGHNAYSSYIIFSSSAKRTLRCERAVLSRRRFSLQNEDIFHYFYRIDRPQFKLDINWQRYNWRGYNYTCIVQPWKLMIRYNTWREMITKLNNSDNCSQSRTSLTCFIQFLCKSLQYISKWIKIHL